MSGSTVGDVLSVVEEHYPPALAEPWDSVGLVVGARGDTVSTVLCTVDVTLEVVQEAIALHAADGLARDAGIIIVAHHPLFFRPVQALDADHPKGRVATELIRHGIALYVAHTNADVPPGGVVDALADAIGLVDRRPLVPGATPDTGLGRVGTLPAAVSLGQLVERAGAALPRTGGGLRVSGDLDRSVRTVAVQAGAGDDLLDVARGAGADVYLTSDLRHHPASEARAWPDAPALVDVPHWAAESLWLPVLARLVSDELAERGQQVRAVVSEICTDPWTSRW